MTGVTHRDSKVMTGVTHRDSEAMTGVTHRDSEAMTARITKHCGGAVAKQL